MYMQRVVSSLGAVQIYKSLILFCPDSYPPSTDNTHTIPSVEALRRVPSQGRSPHASTRHAHVQTAGKGTLKGVRS
jgi:hypothetical protein